VFNNLIKRIEQGEIKPVVAKSFTLEEIRDAQTLFLEKATCWKNCAQDIKAIVFFDISNTTTVTIID